MEIFLPNLELEEGDGEAERVGEWNDETEVAVVTVVVAAEAAAAEEDEEEEEE